MGHFEIFSQTQKLLKLLHDSLTLRGIPAAARNDSTQKAKDVALLVDGKLAAMAMYQAIRTKIHLTKLIKY